MLADTGSFIAATGATMDIGDATAHSLIISGDANALAFKVTGGKSQLGETTFIGQVNAVPATISTTAIRYKFIQQPIGDAAPRVVNWGPLVCDNTKIGSTAVGYKPSPDDVPLPLDTLDPFVVDFTEGSFLLMYCAPGYANAGWLPLGSRGFGPQ